MHVEVRLEPYEDFIGERASLTLNCGSGDQILRWVGNAACARLCAMRGQSHGKYVPQAVRDDDGHVLDADTILSAAFADGSAIRVDYSNGPLSFRARWTGRPKTPPFRWGLHGEEAPGHDNWLAERDFTDEPLVMSALPSLLSMDAETASVYDAAEDCEALHTYLISSAGSIQALFFLLESSKLKRSSDTRDRLHLTQFRSYVQSIVPDFPIETCDEIFLEVTTNSASIARKSDAVEGAASMDLQDFLFALVHVSSHWASGNVDAVLMRQSGLAGRFESFWKKCCSRGILQELQTRVIRCAEHPDAEVRSVMKSYRRFTEQTLENCQMKRIRANELRVELRHVWRRLADWGLLEREFSAQDLAAMAIFAKQESTELERFVLHSEPLCLNYDEFEKLLGAIVWHMCLMHKKKEHFQSFSSETLNEIYRKAGVFI